MKKSVLVTSILFSTMMFGSSILNDSQVTLKAADSLKLQEGSIKNVIRFVNQDGMPLNRYHDTIQTFTGQTGDDIDLESVVPDGYLLHDKQQHLKIQNSDEIRVVVVDAQEVTNHINFKDIKSKKILESVTLTGKVGDVYRFPTDKLPDGYHYEANSRTDDITLSAVEKEINIWIVENKKEKNVKLRFVDKDGKYISEKDIMCPVGEVYELPSRMIFGTYYLPEYELEDNQPISFAVNEDTKEVEIKVKKIFTENILDFKDGDEIVDSVTVEGVLDRKKDINDFIPDKYDLVDPSDSAILIGNQGSHKEIKVKKVSVVNTIQFKDEKGMTIDSVNIEGKTGHKKDISYLIPDEYGLVSPIDNSIIMGYSGTRWDIKVKKNTVINTIKFKDEKGNIVDSIDIKGKKNYVEGISFYLPRGYAFKNRGDWEVTLKNNGSTIVIDVLKKVENIIQYITPEGNEVRINRIDGKVGESIEVDRVEGYKFVGDKKIILNPIDGYIHKILVEGKKFKTELNFKDDRYHRVHRLISKEAYSGKIGDKVPDNLIPKGYVLSGENILFGNTPSEIVWIRKKVETIINYVDALGRVVGNQKSTNLDEEKIRLSVPKGYLLVNNSVGTFEVNQEHPVQNVLVIPANGVQQPVLPNIVSTQINFINRKNNQVIHSYVVQGQHGQSLNLQTPEGYDLAKGVTNKLILDKSKKLINIYMVEKEVTNTTGVSVPHSKTVLTKQTASLYDKNGNKITNRALSHSSGWKSDQKMVLNGVTYYRVATNEYVKADDIVEYESSVSVVKTTTGSAKFLYDVQGKRSSDRALGSNTAWFTDKSAIINGEKMYRVATNEWVKASDIK